MSERDLIIHVSVKTVQDIGATLEEVYKQIEAHTGKCTLRIDVFDDESMRALGIGFVTGWIGGVFLALWTMMTLGMM